MRACTHISLTIISFWPCTTLKKKKKAQLHFSDTVYSPKQDVSAGTTASELITIQKRATSSALLPVRPLNIPCNTSPIRKGAVWYHAQHDLESVACTGSYIPKIKKPSHCSRLTGSDWWKYRWCPRVTPDTELAQICWQSHTAVCLPVNDSRHASM